MTSPILKLTGKSRKMEKIDAKIVKEKIIRSLEEKGPSLPVQLAKVTGLNSIFTSAFLSELASEGIVKISNMKVGGSPLYFVPNKINMLENFTNYLGPKEREAQTLLKEKNFLEDREQTPVIRVALRSLKDFAIPLKTGDRIVWKYFLAQGEPKTIEKTQEKEERKITEKIMDTMIDQKNEFKTPEERFEEKQEEIKKVKQEEIKKEKLEEEKSKEVEEIKKELEERNKELELLKTELLKKPEEIKKPRKKPVAIKKAIDDSFLNEVKENLIKKGIDFLEVIEFDKKQVIAKVKKEEKELLLFALDRKRVDEEELIKAYKKAASFGLDYLIFFKGELPKKTKETIEAYKSLNSIDKFE